MWFCESVNACNGIPPAAIFQCEPIGEPHLGRPSRLLSLRLRALRTLDADGGDRALSREQKGAFAP